MVETKSAPRRKSTRKSKVENDPSTEIGDTEESEGAYGGNPSLCSDRSDTGEPSDTETMEDDDLMLKDLHIEGRSKLTLSGEGPASWRGFVRRDREGIVASSVDTMGSAPIGQAVKGRKKAATQPPGILNEQR